jgi:predicted Zn-dependent protease with MMP-like domain
MESQPPDPLASLLERIDQALDDGDIDDARAALALARELAGEAHPEVLYAEAGIAWEEHGPDAAEALLHRIVKEHPDHADAWYGLARIAEERDDARAMVEHDLRVLELDEKADHGARIGSPDELDYIEAVARDVLEELPSPFAERLEHVPVVLESRPSRDLVSDGFDPRALGLFEGPTDGDSDTPAPTRIVLFTSNLLVDFVEEEELREQIEITLLHEIGHFFNLDEDDLKRLGLD